MEGKKSQGKRSLLKEKADKLRGRFTSSERFKKMCRDAFKAVDLDNSNSLDPTEVYCAILFVYTKVIAYVATAVPPSREFVLQLFKDVDVDNTGTLDLEEFEALSVVLFAHIASRITTEAMFYFVVAPIFATFVFQLLDLLFVVPSWMPHNVAVLLLNFRDMIMVTLIVIFVVPQFLKTYESYAHKRTKDAAKKQHQRSSEMSDETKNEAVKKER
mmetsp:Transcript_12798/g.14770  ORF Transcript_12798/g.14770 Transcript_12798/m.14770 type:complete len:215 (+) Transcript_12798:183-827(+)|eukprot:CAMPEP_0204835090 /NCGR_PEP_ID=MMETSP1346-20131115/21562_1 /ASSEMBLY_ACC=CAM_ASM_000771 /TAXON_ID=215587 /ORGANISM="Aplanochytrium stocchinoi, Strain GSBS06" /LENGTH=214 /DNA_ID=CAMNT_0051968797 /DNA_START=103 /DNA_END=747 /DNA_ORIENTATION=+